jgi:hypothetical protein
MKIVVKSIKNEESDLLVYLRTDDDVNVHAEFATMETYQYIIKEMTEGDNSIPVFMDIAKEEVKEEDMGKKLPVILVFYLDRGLMENRQIINPFAAAVNEAIVEKDANVMAFFLPTDREERIECINPLIATPKERMSISNLISDISQSFDISQGADEDYDDVNIINTSDED